MKSILTGIVIAAIVGFCWISTPALAAEQALTFKPESVAISKDKNGNEFVRMVISENKTANGIPFKSSYTVNAYREHVAQAKLIKPGQEVTAVVQMKEYNGQKYGTILGFAPAPAKKQ